MAIGQRARKRQPEGWAIAVCYPDIRQQQPRERRTVQYQPDITITDRFGALVALVEVKALGEADAREATYYLHRLLTYGGIPAARYLLLITTRAGYLWTSADDVLHEATPTLAFAMDGVIHYFLPKFSVTSVVEDPLLQVLAEQWLWSVVDGIESDSEVTASLREVGFLNAVRGGTVNVFATV